MNHVPVQLQYSGEFFLPLQQRIPPGWLRYIEEEKRCPWILDESTWMSNGASPSNGNPTLKTLAHAVPFSGITPNCYFGIVSRIQKSGRNHGSHPVLLGNYRKSLACSTSPKVLLPGGTTMPFPSSVILIDIRAI